jgi:hypothetical protein
MTPSNFSFLEHEFPILHNIASAAEYHLYADPVTALFKLRPLGEMSAETFFDTRLSRLFLPGVTCQMQ